MRTFLANWLASLILDEWPLPNWLRRRIESHPDVTIAIRAEHTLRSRLRQDVDAYVDDRQAVAVEVQRPMPSSETRRVTGHRWMHVAVAAMLLIAAGWYVHAKRTPTAAKPLEANLHEVDIGPIVASLNAGQQVANRVSDGLRSLSDQFASLGQDFTKRLAGMVAYDKTLIDLGSRRLPTLSRAETKTGDVQ